MHLGSNRVHNLIINRTKFLGDMVVGDSKGQPQVLNLQYTTSR